MSIPSREDIEKFIFKVDYCGDVEYVKNNYKRFVILPYGGFNINNMCFMRIYSIIGQEMIDYMVDNIRPDNIQRLDDVMRHIIGYKMDIKINYKLFNILLEIIPYVLLKYYDKNNDRITRLTQTSFSCLMKGCHKFCRLWKSYEENKLLYSVLLSNINHLDDHIKDNVKLYEDFILNTGCNETFNLILDRFIILGIPIENIVNVLKTNSIYEYHIETASKYVDTIIKISYIELSIMKNYTKMFNLLLHENIMDSVFKNNTHYTKSMVNRHIKFLLNKELSYSKTLAIRLESWSNIPNTERMWKTNFIKSINHGNNIEKILNLQ